MSKRNSEMCPTPSRVCDFGILEMDYSDIMSLTKI